MVSIFMVLVDGHDERCAVYHRKSPIKGLPNEPMIPMAPTYQHWRNRIIQASFEHKEVNKIRHLQSSSPARKCTDILGPLRPIEFDWIRYIEVPSLCH